MYFIRRILYCIPILIGVNLLTFFLFFTVNTPDDIARMQLGIKYVDAQAIGQWKKQHGYDVPYYYNPEASGVEKLTKTLWLRKTVQLFSFDFGRSLFGHWILHDIKQRMGPSLLIALPTLILGLLMNITCALCLAYTHRLRFDRWGCLIAMMMMSISGLFYIIVGQYIVGIFLRWVPISGYDSGFSAIKFVLLPIFIGVISTLGSEVRWYRTIFLEEAHKEYVLAARAKGLSDAHVWLRHILRNSLVPIVTGVVAILPLLFMGSLLMESFFSIPGLGSYTLDAIGNQDFEVVRVMVFISTIAYMIGLILTDLVYTLIDPRIGFTR